MLEFKERLLSCPLFQSLAHASVPLGTRRQAIHQEILLTRPTPNSGAPRRELKSAHEPQVSGSFQRGVRSMKTGLPSYQESPCRMTDVVKDCTKTVLLSQTQ